MIGRERLLGAVAGLSGEELELWVAAGWVRPEGEPDRWLFREIDVARVRLIVECRHDLAIDHEAMPVVLALLDQLYGLRRDFGALCRAVAAQPETIREAIAAALDRDRD